MREIKFKGYDKIGKKGWVYGDLVHSRGISRDPKIDMYPRIMVGGYEVIEDSVCEFTGLYDKNNTEIYEGDIVRHFNEEFVVKYDEAAFNVNFYAKVAYNLEVIGNIHTPKEML